LGILSSAATFDEQRAAVSSSIETQPETAIIALLRAGIEEGKPTQAVAEARKWLRQNLAKDGMLLFYAARAAELSGDASGAAALYQQYLKTADPQAGTAGEAVIAVHSLLKDQLNDAAAAYSFNRSVVDRLAVNPTARQFDQWFLDEAVRYKDAVAVANRLHALIKAGIPDDLRVTFYDRYFRWLLEQADIYVEQPGAVPATGELLAACKQLSAAMTFHEELALRLNWAVSVRAYNLARIGEDANPGARKPKKIKKKDQPIETEPVAPAPDVAPPIAEATALLAKFPQYARWVQSGWAGGGNGQYYRGDPAKYWPHEIDAKMAPVVAAAARLTPLQLADLLESWRDRYYADNVARPLAVKAVRDFLAANPKLINSRTGVLLLEKPWNAFTPAEAQALAPLIEQNPDPQASLIRAVAAAGEAKDFDKAMAALLGSEAWRLSAAELDGRYADQLWHYAGRPGDSAKRDQNIYQSKGVAEKIKAEALSKQATPEQRIGLFKSLWADYRSPQPKIPAVYERLKAVLMFTPEVIPDLLGDPAPEAQVLARDAIAAGMSGPDPLWEEIEAVNKVNVAGYAPGILYLAQRHAGGSVPELKKRLPQKCRPHPLEAAMRKSVEDGLKQSRLEPWQVIAWLNMQYPEDHAEQVKLMQALMKSPLWATMPFEAHFAAREWFQKDVMTPGQVAWIDAADPELVCGDLLALVEGDGEAAEKVGKKGKKIPWRKPRPVKEGQPEPDDAEKAAIAAEDVTAATAALQSTIAALSKSPTRIEVPVRALENLAALDPAVFADPGSQGLILQLIDQLKAAPGAANFSTRLFEIMRKSEDPVLIHRAATSLWRGILVMPHHYIFPQARALAESLLDKHPSAASAMALAGRQIFGGPRSNPHPDLPLLKAIVGKAAVKMGLIVIPVAKNDPAFPVYESQAEWLTGNEDSAWKGLDEHWEAFIPIHRELSVSYLMWALQRTIYSRDETRQEMLVKSLLDWAAGAGSPLTPDEKAHVEIAYGDIALQRGQVREALEIYTRIQQNEGYRDLPVRHQAALRRIRAERLAKDFDGALKTIAELEMERAPEVWTATRFARAEVNFDMEEYDAAKDDIESILTREPNHADGRILLGKVQLKRQKLMEATEVELGSASGQKSLVPGEKLKVTLTDPTLAVSGAGTEIEVVVWATSGDRESFFLRQFGDQKTKFRGEAATALGTPAAGDGVLQVIGDDEVFYAYSERFRAKMNNLAEKRGGPITVASDAMLMASARKLLSEAEQRSADMEALMEEIKGRVQGDLEGAARARVAARSLSAEARMENQGISEEDLTRYAVNVVKPGNPVHVRVIDPDRSRTAESDELTVSAVTSSGDSTARITLKETGTHTGWFEGSIPTTGAQAMAIAANSEPGRNPNMVISPTDGYPAWQPVATKGITPEFTVDLNDNVELGEMTLTAAEPGAKLRIFALQTGMSPGDMTTVAAWPKSQGAIKQPWHPSVTVMNDTDRYHAGGGRSVRDLGELVEHLERGWMTQQFAQGFATNVAGPSEALPGPVLEAVQWKRQARSDVSSVIFRFKGYFHEKNSVTRRFRLDLGGFAIPQDTHPSINHPPQFLLAVDGRPITGEDGRLDGSINLQPGLHRFEIWATGWVNNIGFGKRSVKLQANLEAPETLVPCPDSFFDPATFPEQSLDHRNPPATVTAGNDGTGFAVKFAPDSRARLIRLILLDQEGPVPALNKITLTKPDGTRLLPVAEDFATLNKNETLEILTGDRISVRYLDNRFVTKSKEQLERSLNVAFTDARVEFADIQPRFSSRHGKDMPYYERLLRFPYDQALTLVIRDADMDVSVKPDTVKVALATQGAGNHQFDAVETGESTGVFKLVVTPVAGAATGNQISVAEGGTITASYLDHDNNRPGVPVERVATIEHAAFKLPQLVLSHATVTPLESDAMRPLVHGFERRGDHRPGTREIPGESVRPRWQVANTLLPATAAPEGGHAAVSGGLVYLELIAPHLALGTASEVTVFAQTDAGRRAAAAGGGGDGPARTFDISVPGTIALTGRTGDAPGTEDPWRMAPLLPVYQAGGVWNPGDEPQFDRFRLSVPLVAGMLPPDGYLTEEERAERAREAKGLRGAGVALEQAVHGLVVRPGDRIHFGFRYTDASGAEQWLSAAGKVITHPVFDILADDFRSPLTSAYVGESLNLRVVDLGADVSDAVDRVTVLMQAKSGAKHSVELQESGPHTGIFKAGYALSYAAAAPANGDGSAAYDVRSQGFPVIYGDTVAARYTDRNGVKTATAMVAISKGADGTIEPFSKKYDDPEIAMRTQFSLAEAYLELAKRHRKLNEPAAAAREYESAKQLLSKAMDQFTDPETRAHAEYMLGNLTMEEADETGDPELKETRYRAALSRFLNVTGSYPTALHASKAQYKIATVYEALKEPEIAAQEYVKLAYKYPDSEFLAVSMARLGSHFLKKAAAYEDQAKPLLAKGVEDKDASFEGEALRKLAVAEYLKTAHIFGKLQQRFPGNELAGDAGLRAGQAFMRAGRNQEAVDAFHRVIAEQAYDGPKIRSQAMYWVGMCYLEMRQQMAAYSTFKRLTYDFPESQWAAYARGQLSQERLLDLETKLELERMEEGR
jgi:TolA-binding protein